MQYGMQRVLEVAAANEAALNRLTTMIDDFDRRLRSLESAGQEERQAYEEILTRKGRRS